MTITPHVVSYTLPDDPNRNNVRIRVVNSVGEDVVNDLVGRDVASVDVAPLMQNAPSGDYTAWVSTVGPGGEGDPVNAGLFGFFPVPLPVTGATVS